MFTPRPGSYMALTIHQNNSQIAYNRHVAAKADECGCYKGDCKTYKTTIAEG